MSLQQHILLIKLVLEMTRMLEIIFFNNQQGILHFGYLEEEMVAHVEKTDLILHFKGIGDRDDQVAVPFRVDIPGCFTVLSFELGVRRGVIEKVIS